MPRTTGLGPYVESGEIRYRVIDGCGVVLDLRTQRYSVLDELATGMWAVATGEVDRATQLRRWTAAFDSPADEIRRAIDVFAAERLAKGWLRRAGSGRDPARSRDARRVPRWRRAVPRGFLALAALAFTAGSLKLRGFSRTYDIAPRADGLAPHSARAMRRTLDAFLRAENCFFFARGSNDCLVRSLALFRYLSWLGLPATHVIGVRRLPFAAHAWVEIEGEGLLAPAPRDYAILATLDSVDRDRRA